MDEHPIRSCTLFPSSGFALSWFLSAICSPNLPKQYIALQNVIFWVQLLVDRFLLDIRFSKTSGHERTIAA
jgi:hypothetical protein